MATEPWAEKREEQISQLPWMGSGPGDVPAGSAQGPLPGHPRAAGCGKPVFTWPAPWPPASCFLKGHLGTWVLIK